MKNKKDTLLKKNLLDILACPICKSDLSYSKDEKVLECTKCHSEYPIKGGIPIFADKMSEIFHQFIIGGRKAKTHRDCGKY